MPTKPAVAKTPNSHFIGYSPSTGPREGSRLTKSLGYCSDYTGNPPAGLHGFVKFLHGKYSLDHSGVQSIEKPIVENVMGLLDGVLGGLVGAGINEMIQRHGGVQGLVNQF